MQRPLARFYAEVIEDPKRTWFTNPERLKLQAQGLHKSAPDNLHIYCHLLIDDIVELLTVGAGVPITVPMLLCLLVCHHVGLPYPTSV